ncbi:Tetratricopeptide Repeat Protein 12 [Manis pentadactyla]|nr:Tetratricopeptide Repeat Protein 12 [Manis pentadactyla]
MHKKNHKTLNEALSADEEFGTNVLSIRKKCKMGNSAALGREILYMMLTAEHTTIRASCVNRYCKEKQRKNISIPATDQMGLKQHQERIYLMSLEA